MTSEQIKEYLSILVDMEKNKYIQEKTIANLRTTARRLGIKKDFQKPYPRTASSDYGESILGTGVIAGIIIAIIAAIITLIIKWEKWSIFAIFIALVIGVLVGIVGGFIFGLIIGPISESASVRNRQKSYDYEYNRLLKEYDRLVEMDKERVKKEICQRQFIYSEINALEHQLSQTKANLEKLYNYNIIDPTYWYDIVAICSFYQYFCREQTFSLGFDRNTGDKGAYNIYEEEKRLGIIISKLDDVLIKLDTVITNQNMIAQTLKQANNQISLLSNNVNNMSRQITAVNNSIKQQTAIQEYSAQRTNEELRYMNTMNIIYKWH